MAHCSILGLEKHIKMFLLWKKSEHGGGQPTFEQFLSFFCSFSTPTFARITHYTLIPNKIE